MTLIAIVSRSSLPGLTRQSIKLQNILAKKMDPRVKPAGDSGVWFASAKSMQNPREKD
jgi:hypothetical protein